MSGINLRRIFFSVVLMAIAALLMLLPYFSAHHGRLLHESRHSNSMDVGRFPDESDETNPPLESMSTEVLRPVSDYVEEETANYRNIINTTTRLLSTSSEASTVMLPPCPSHGVVYVVARGRLGNLIWEYVAAFFIAQGTGLKPFVHPEIRMALDKVFMNLRIPAREMQDCGRHLKYISQGRLVKGGNTRSINIGPYHGSYYRGIMRIIVTHQTEVRQVLQFHPHLVEHAQEVLRALRRDSNTVYIGVHVRRTDYIQHLHTQHNIKQANVSFYEHAMDMFRRKHKGAVFIVFSDDIGWCQTYLCSNFTDVVFENGTVEQDLATLATCNHTIIDYGTFGEWGSILAGGETIVYNLAKYKFHTSYMAALLKWTLIK